MRIIHVITRLIVGGAQENTILTCEGLHARGHEVYLFSGPTSGPEGSLLERAHRSGYTFEEFDDLVRQVSPIHDLKATLALRRRFAELRPAIIHTHSSKAGVIGRIAAAGAEMPYVVHTIHGMSFNRTQPRLIQKAYALAERYCAEKTAAIVCVADAMTQQSLAAGVGYPEQYETVRSGIEVSTFNPSLYDANAVRSEWGIGTNEIVVGTVARLFVNKGYEQLIEIMGEAVAKCPRLRFVWIGDGQHRRRYEQELTRRGLRDRVHLLGLIPPSQMPRMLAGIDILAHTSQWEGLPRAVVQAMLMEKPAVSFDIDGAPEVVLPGRTGELAARGDLQGFAAALLKLAADASLRRDYGRRGRELCVREFDHNVMVDRLEKLYNRILIRDGQ